MNLSFFAHLDTFRFTCYSYFMTLFIAWASLILMPSVVAVAIAAVVYSASCFIAYGEGMNASENDRDDFWAIDLTPNPRGNMTAWAFNRGYTAYDRYHNAHA